MSERATPDLHELVAEHEHESSGWRRWVYLIAAVFIAIAIGALGYVVKDNLSGRITKVEGVEDPCSADLHGVVCQARTCERLRDVGFPTTGRCRFLLGLAASGGIGEGPGASERMPNAEPSEEVVVGGGKNPSGQPGPPAPGGPPSRFLPEVCVNLQLVQGICV